MAATEGVHKELSAFFAAPETRYLATFAGVVMPMEKKKGQKTGKRLRGTQVVRTQERESKYWLLHDAVETARSLRNKAPPPVHCSKPGGYQPHQRVPADNALADGIHEAVPTDFLVHLDSDQCRTRCEATRRL